MATPVVYNQFKLKEHNGNAINLASGVIKVMIVTVTYVFNQAHAFKSDITNEVTGTNYVAGGTAISGVTLVLSTNTVQWAHNNITWAQSAGAGFANGRQFIWYEDTGVAGTSKLIMCDTEAADFGNVAGDLILNAATGSGVLNLT